MKKVLISIITFIIICISIWFQIGFLNAIPLVGVMANLGIILSAGLGLISGRVVGGLVGGVYGLLVDISFGRSIGLYTFLYIMVGVVAGYLNKRFSKGNRISMIMLVLLCTCLFEVVAYFMNIVLNGYNLSIETLMMYLILESVYNVLLTIILFKPIAFYGDIINKSKNSYYIL